MINEIKQLKYKTKDLYHDVVLNDTYANDTCEDSRNFVLGMSTAWHCLYGAEGVKIHEINDGDITTYGFFEYPVYGDEKHKPTTGTMRVDLSGLIVVDNLIVYANLPLLRGYSLIVKLGDKLTFFFPLRLGEFLTKMKIFY